MLDSTHQNGLLTYHQYSTILDMVERRDEMPIVNMVSKAEDAPAGAVNLREVTERWKGHSANSENFTLWLYDTHVGLCVKEREANFYDDSDFYMTVWNPEKKAPEEICFASTRGWTYPCLGSKVDASPDVMAEYRAYMLEREREAREARAAAEAAKPARGKILRVVRGRKVPIGTSGTCIWTGEGRYGSRVGIKDYNGGVHWTAASNVEVVPVSA